MAIVLKSGNLNLLKSSGTVQASTGIALPLYIYIYIYLCVCVCVCVYVFAHTHTHTQTHTHTYTHLIYDLVYTEFRLAQNSTCARLSGLQCVSRSLPKPVWPSLNMVIFPPFCPGRAKDLSAPRYIEIVSCNPGNRTHYSIFQS
jgi:hypothetical protein